jgi:hypothetical protein
VSCPACAAGDQSEFSVEMIAHIGGFKNLDNPGVRVFAKLSICLDCGYSRFTVPEAELRLLAIPTPPRERLAMAAN